jgi:hypothetical protein
MLKRYCGFIALLCALNGFLFAQNLTTFGNIVSAGTPCGASNCVYYQLPPGTPWVSVTATGTWNGTLEIATSSAPNANYSNLNTIAWTVLATETANGTWGAMTSGATYLRVRATVWTGGTAQVTMESLPVLTSLVNPIFPGTVSATGVQAPNVNGVLHVGTANGYPTLAAAIAALPAAGGTVETPPGYTETASAFILGSSTQAVTLLAGTNTTLTCTGTSSTCMQIFNGSSAICLGSSGRSCTLISAQTTPLSLVSNGQQNGSQEYFKMEGWTIDCGNGPVFTNGCVDINTGFVPSVIRDTTIYGFVNSIGLHLHATTGTNGGLNVFKLDNLEVDGVNQAGAQPVVIDKPAGTGSGGLVSAIHFSGGAIEDPGVGYPALLVNGNGSYYQMAVISFDTTQVQGNNSSTTSPVKLIDAQGVSITNMMVNNAGGAGTPAIVEISRTVANGTGNIFLQNIRGNAGFPVVQNDIDGVASQVGDYLLSGYWYQGSAYASPFIFDGVTDFITPVSAAYTAQGPAMVLGTNLVYNGTMAGSGTAATGWNTQADGGASCTFLVDTSTYPTGSTQSQKMTLTNATNVCELNSNASPASLFSLVSGSTYQVSAWMKNDGSSIGVTAFLGTSGSNDLCPITWQNSGPYPLTSTWTKLTGTCTATGSSSSSRFIVFTQPPGTNGSVWVGGVFAALESAPENTTFTNASVTSVGSGVVAAGDSAGGLTAAVASNVVGLFSGCSGTQYLGADGACHTSPGSASSMICTYPTESASNTGNMNENPIYNCAIPAGTMGTASKITSSFYVLSGASTSGTCAMRIRWSTTSGSITGTIVGASVVSGNYSNGWTNLQLFNANSLTAQNGNYSGYGNSGGQANGNITGALNTGTTTTYLTVTLQNTVSGDNCFVNSGSVYLGLLG